MNTEFEFLNVGITGTREGMTSLQFWEVAELLLKLEEKSDSTRVPVLSHGDCVGVDSQCHDIAFQIGYLIDIHPGPKGKLSAGRKGHWHRARAPHLKRNQNIVDATDYLIGVPSHHTEILRSGTWSTIRYAKSNNKPIVIVYPDGEKEYINGYKD
jgi:hypothetical protein